MADALSTLVLGASYGSILGCRLLYAGHGVKLVCEPDSARMLQIDGFRVRLPVHGQQEPLEVDSRLLAGTLSASGPEGIDPSAYDLVVLAMQEPQYGLPGFRELLAKIGRCHVPCVSLMMMPPLPYLRRIPSLDAANLSAAYTDAPAWESLAASRLTHCSPEWPAVRAWLGQPNAIHVLLPVRLRIAPFESPEHTALLHRMAQRNDARFPLKLTVADSVFVPLATWPSTIAGGYRCITDDGIRCARETVLADIATSQSVYEFVAQVCLRLGSRSQDITPFDEYAAAAEGLSRPDSPARALQDGAQHIERTDRLVQMAAWQQGMRHPAIDRLVATVDRRIEENRRVIRH